MEGHYEGRSLLQGKGVRSGKRITAFAAVCPDQTGCSPLLHVRVVVGLDGQFLATQSAPGPASVDDFKLVSRLGERLQMLLQKARLDGLVAYGTQRGMVSPSIALLDILRVLTVCRLGASNSPYLCRHTRLLHSVGVYSLIVIFPELIKFLGNGTAGHKSFCFGWRWELV